MLREPARFRARDKFRGEGYGPPPRQTLSSRPSRAGGRRWPPFFSSGSENARRLDRDLGVFDLPEAVDQALPLVRFEQRRELASSGLPFERVVADVDVVVVVGHREAGRPGRSSSEITWWGCIVPCSCSTSRISSSVSVPGPWWPVTGTPLIAGDVDRVAGACARRRCRRW